MTILKHAVLVLSPAFDGDWEREALAAEGGVQQLQRGDERGSGGADEGRFGAGEVYGGDGRF